MSDIEWPLVRELFDAVVELPEAERAAHLGRAAVGPEVRAEVERMLRSDGVATGFLESSSALVEKTLLPRTGTRLGHYELKRVIASGGMGTVFEAVQDEPRRTVALKTLRLGLFSSPERLQRFRFEAEVLGHLRHPSIAQIFEAGTHEEAGEVVPFIAMELVSGARDLLSFAREEELELPARLELFREICEAVQHGHQKGVIHRDLKPGNILVDAEGRAKVIDFGVARATARASGFGDVTTQTGQILGTLAYMAPEQLAGSAESVDVRSDVYALGVVLFELIEGRPPHELADKSPAAALRAIQEEAPRPSAGTPRELRWILVKNLAKEPERRYGSAAELAADLGRYLRGEPVLAGVPSVTYRLSKWIQRNPAKTAAAAIGVAAFVAITGLLIQNVRTNIALKAKTAEVEARAADALENARVAMANERRATDEKERADREAEAARNSEREAVLARDDVLRLSALQRLDDLTNEADLLWPAHPENIRRFEAWLARAESLVAELPEHEQKLAELRTKARPWTAEEQAEFRATDSRAKDLERVQREIDFVKTRRTLLMSDELPPEPTAAEAGVDFASLPADAVGLNRIAWELVHPDRRNFGGESKGLVLARRALELSGDFERPTNRNTLAWALFATCRFDDAVAEEERALEEAMEERKLEYEDSLARMREAIEAEIEPGAVEKAQARVAQLGEQLAGIESELSTRPEWTFEDDQDKWWHNQLEKLVHRIRAFADGTTGLCSEGASAEHGWGVKKRLSNARRLQAGFAPEGEQSRAWEAVLPEIRATYPGLELTSQLGLVPIGPDPDSGLWEFAHLETGEPAVRGADGKLVLKDETGLVFVLLPGGTFQMGAQRTDPMQPNYDPQAGRKERPVREVTLSPFFLSKYEMTQGQWLWFTGNNPSYYRAGKWVERPTKPFSLIHPVEGVSWNECVEVTSRLGLSLPTEAQWEYGCRGGTSSVWWTGNEPESLTGKANLADRSALRLETPFRENVEDWLDDGYPADAPVNSFPPNAFGLHNVAGNLWEFCLDGYDGEDYSGVPTRDPLYSPEGSSGRMTRGGSFTSEAELLRSASRYSGTPEDTDASLGLRPARSITP